MKLYQHKVKIDEIHEVQLLTHEYPGVKEALELALSIPEYKKVIPDTWALNGEGALKGSTSFSTPILTNCLRRITQDNSIFPLTQADSERALRNTFELSRNPNWPGLIFYDEDTKKTILVKGTLLNPAKTYTDTMCFAVNPNLGPNEILKKNIVKQINSESKYHDNIDLKMPFVVGSLISFRKNNNADYGLEVLFDKDGLTEVYNHPALLKGLLKGGIFEFNFGDLGLIETGFPYKLGEGDRELLVANSGVRVFCRYGNLNLDAGGEDLGGWSGGGRGYVVKKISGNGLEVLVSQ